MGMGAAAAVGAVGAAGAYLSGRSTESSEKEEGLHGSVSRRISSMERGGGAAPYIVESEDPSFVSVPNSPYSQTGMSVIGETEIHESPIGGGIEVEGPWRPSSIAHDGTSPHSVAAYPGEAQGRHPAYDATPYSAYM